MNLLRTILQSFFIIIHNNFFRCDRVLIFFREVVRFYSHAIWMFNRCENVEEEEEEKKRKLVQLSLEMSNLERHATTNRQ